MVPKLFEAFESRIRCRPLGGAEINHTVTGNRFPSCQSGRRHKTKNKSPPTRISLRSRNIQVGEALQWHRGDDDHCNGGERWIDTGYQYQSIKLILRYNSQIALTPEPSLTARGVPELPVCVCACATAQDANTPTVKRIDERRQIRLKVHTSLWVVCMICLSRCDCTLTAGGCIGRYPR